MHIDTFHISIETKKVCVKHPRRTFTLRSLWGEFGWVREKGSSQKIDAEQSTVETMSSKTRLETFLNPEN